MICLPHAALERLTVGRIATPLPMLLKVVETVDKMLTKTAEGNTWLRDTAEAPVYHREDKGGLEHGR